MATTTNYGWTTPDDTALVKDGASAIRTLGSSVDTTTKALNPSTTLGDIEYRSSTANTNTRLGIGTTGQVLTVSGGVPAWSAAPSSSPTSGQNRVNTQESTGSTTYTGLTTAQTVTMTTGTKVLVIVSCTLRPNSGSALASYAISGATTLAASDAWAIRNGEDGGGATAWMAMSYVSYQTVTAGSNTFTMQFRTFGDTCNFSNRQITVIDLGS